jgi:hypothetical protein
MIKLLSFIIMKKIRMGFIALAALAGIGNAYAFNHHKAAGTTYFGYKDASGNARWELAPQAHTSCNTDAVGIACTITSTASQSVVLATENALPPNSNIQGHPGELYK